MSANWVLKTQGQPTLLGCFIKSCNHDWFFEIIKSVIPFSIILLIYKYGLQPELTKLDPSVINKTYYLTYLAPLAAIFGHMYPVYFKFKGGKAVATTAGFVFVVSPW